MILSLIFIKINDILIIIKNKGEINMKINLSESAKLKMQEYFKNEVPLRLIVQGVS